MSINCHASSFFPFLISFLEFYFTSAIRIIVNASSPHFSRYFFYFLLKKRVKKRKIFAFSVVEFPSSKRSFFSSLLQFVLLHFLLIHDFLSIIYSNTLYLSFFGLFNGISCCRCCWNKIMAEMVNCRLLKLMAGAMAVNALHSSTNQILHG